jgi:transcriptional regulator with XRE-family HTH domain
MTYSEMIKQARKDSGLTLEYVAEKLGTSASYLHDIENGRTKTPKMALLTALAGFFYIDRDKLLVAAERVPDDVFYKIIRNPQLITLIRNTEV